MKKRYLALLMVVPLLLLCISAFIRWSEVKLLSNDINSREAVHILKERALHADKEANPQARIEVLSKALIGVAAATDTMVNGYAQAVQASTGVLEGLAILQILLSAYVFRRCRLPNHGVQPTQTSGAADTGRWAQQQLA